MFRQIDTNDVNLFYGQPSCRAVSHITCP